MVNLTLLMPCTHGRTFNRAKVSRESVGSPAERKRTGSLSTDFRQKKSDRGYTRQSDFFYREVRPCVRGITIRKSNILKIDFFLQNSTSQHQIQIRVAALLETV